MTRRRALVIMSTWIVVVVVLWLSNSRPAVLVLGGIVVVVAAVVLAIIDLGGTIDRVRWTRRSGPPSRPRAADRRVTAVRHQVRGAWLSGSPQINETLIELLDDRLVAHRHIDRATDPVAADRVLTPSLRQVVAGPRRQTATVRELRQILTDVEAI